MKTKQLHQAGPRTFAVVFDKDDEVIEGLTAFTREHAIAAAQITAIGAFKAVTFGFLTRTRWTTRSSRSPSR